MQGGAYRFVLPGRIGALLLLALAALSVALAAWNWKDDFVQPAETEPDRLFREEYAVCRAQPDPSPPLAAAQWVHLVGSWCRSSRPVSFSDLILVLPPPAAWPFLPPELEKSRFDDEDRKRIVALLVSLLADDGRQASLFTDVAGSIRPEGKLQQLNHLLFVGDCLASDPQHTAAMAAPMRHLAAEAGHAFPHDLPAGTLYLPDLPRYASPEQAQLLAGDLLKIRAKRLDLSFSGPDLVWMRREAEAVCPEMTQFPLALYLKDPGHSGVADAWQLYLRTHPDIFSWNIYPLVLLNCLVEKPSQDWSGAFTLEQAVEASTRLPRAALENNVEEEAYAFLRKKVADDPRLYPTLTELALMTHHLAEIAPLATTPDSADALSRAYWQSGWNDAAFAATRENLERLHHTPENAIGIDEDAVHILALREIKTLLAAGVLLHRDDWLDEAVRQAREELDSVLDRNGAPSIRSTAVIELTSALIQAGRDREAETLMDDMARVYPVEVSSDYFFAANHVVAWYHLREWEKILALSRDDRATWKNISTLELGLSLQPGDVATPEFMRLQALIETGRRTEAAEELRLLLVAGASTAAPREINMAFDLLGPEQALRLFDIGNWGGGLREGLAERLDPSLRSTFLEQIDFQNFGRRAIAQPGPSLPPRGGSVEEFELLWSHGLQTDALSRLAPSSSPLVNLSLGEYFEDVGDTVHADQAYQRGLGELAGLQGDAAWLQFANWIQALPKMTQRLRTALEADGDHNAGWDALRGEAALSENNDAAAGIAFHQSLARAPDNPAALEGLLKLSLAHPLPSPLLRHALEILAAKAGLEQAPPPAFGLNDFWKRAFDRPLLLRATRATHPPASPVPTSSDSRELNADLASSRCLIELSNLLDQW